MSDVPEATKPTPAASDLASSKRAPFLPAFGRTAFLLGGGSLPLGCLFGILVRSTQEGPNADPTATSIFALAAAVVIAICAVAGVVFGVLSLFGFGKVNGTSRPIMGAIGALVGGLMCASLVVSFVAAAGMKARHDAQEKVRLASESWPFVDGASGLTFHRPGPAWMLRTGAEAKALNPLAIAFGFDSSDAHGHERLVMILSEDLAGTDVAQRDLLALGQGLAESSGMANRTVESVELIEMDGAPAVKYVVSSDAAGVRGRQFAVAVLRDDRCVQFLFAGEADDPDLSAPEFAMLLSNVKFE
jgi:hypothetical protein